MSFETGSKIGKYEIQSLLGIGGMGEVYRALDTELNRAVAIKFLSADHAASVEQMNRFMQEAHSASALNHPNILTIYEIGPIDEKEDSSRFFVTELIDGTTLREYVGSAKMKLGDVLDIVVQIASALVAAHAAGIIHRDIKPENIMIRRDGYVKVLDFGLAKPTGRTSVDNEGETKMLIKTNPGTVMGTVNYMSPEQASGKEVDERTDIWSLGVVLYEMLSGQAPFAGKTASHTIVTILEKEPLPLSAFVKNVPKPLEWVISETLAKDREDRCQTAHELVGKLKILKQHVDVETELERSISLVSIKSGDFGETLVYPRVRLSSPLSEMTNSAENKQKIIADDSGIEHVINQIRLHKTRSLIAGILGLIVLMGLTIAIYNSLNRKQALVVQQPSPQIKITRLTNNGRSSSPVVSPDGKYVVYLFEEGGKHSLLLRQVATTSTREIIPPFEEDFLGATFSPDGNELYFVRGEKGGNISSLYRISTLGGEIQRLIGDVESAVTFSPNGRKIAFLRGYFKERKQSLFIADLDGSNEERILSYQLPLNMFSPAWSPNGKTIAFALSGRDAEGYFITFNEIRLEDKTERQISSERWRSLNNFSWLPNGSGLITAARDRASSPGTPMQVWRISYPDGELRRISNDSNEYASASFSANAGVLISEFRSVVASVWVAPAENAAHKAQQITPENFAGADGVAWAGDGKVIYTSLERENLELWMANSDGSNKKQLTFNPAADVSPSVSADGRYIVFESNRGAGWGIWRMNADGSNPIEILSNIGRSFPKITPDGRWIVYADQSSGNPQLRKIPFEGGSPVVLIDKFVFNHAVSPDGKWVAYSTKSSEPNAPLKIEIISIDGGITIKTLLAPASLGSLQWSADTHALTYSQTQNGISNLWSLPVNGGQPKQITDWKSEIIYGFEWASHKRLLICSRGAIAADLVLIENIR